MATRIRLRRIGRKKQASFRIVVAGSMHASSGRITETIGKYNPRTEPAFIEIDEVRALYWLRQGAMVSEGVEPLFRRTGILKKFADGAAGEGLAVIGDPQGKTMHPPKAKPGKKKAEKAEAAAEPAPPAAAKAEAPEAEATEGETPEAEAAASETPEAEAAEPAGDVAEPEAETEKPAAE